MDRDFMGNVIKDINKPKTKYDIEKQYWIEYSEELQSRINKAIEYIEQETTNCDIYCDGCTPQHCPDIKKIIDILKGSDSNEIN